MLDNIIQDSAKKSLKDTSKTEGSDTSQQQTVPSISLPKGGGAIRGIGEKFSATPVTGTGSLTVPILTSPGRSGFGPMLSLSYDSGAGNGPFGFGWTLSLPAITRKTDKGLPRYRDGDFVSSEESDIFILSDSEDLVPVLNKIEKDDGTQEFVIDEESQGDYIVYRYRPRIEGLFARIERWTHKNDGDLHWRTISKDNILTVYGRNAQSRIADPSDKNRIFIWLICESYDDKGNAILYEYAAEDEKDIDIYQINERNRKRTANRYIKRIMYGNRQPLLLDITRSSFRKSHIEQSDFSSIDWMFEVVFDYGGEDHYKILPLDSNKPKEEQHQFVQASSASSEGSAWPSRPDPFSVYRAGFEVRTYRRCQRVLMFHSFPELGNEPCLVRSTEFDYSDFDYYSTDQQQQPQSIRVETELAHKGSTRFASFIQAVTQSGYVQDKTKGIALIDNITYLTYLKKSLPPVQFEYSQATIQEKVQEINSESLENLPYGLDGSKYQWVDLDGEGISSILTEQGDEWFYKPNLGEGKFGPILQLDAKPSLSALGSGRQQLLDLAGDGQLDVVEFDGPVSGFYERTNDQDWENFVPFTSLPNVSWKDPNLRFVDLTGDGHADVLITEEQVFSWYPSLAEEGFRSASKVYQELDEEKGPQLVFDDGTQSIYLSDMSGDGLTDLIRIQNGEVCYWPNLGYGHFGAKVTMDNAPWFDIVDLFDQKRIRLADIDGSGTTDIIYLGCNNSVQIYFNQSGNRWSNAYTLSNFPHIDNLSSIQVVDLFGSGTACIVWSSPLPGDSRVSMRYIDLMGSRLKEENEETEEKEDGLVEVQWKKPHLLVDSKNNLGAETKIYYAHSTKFYLEDKQSGKPWITRLPFPVHVVEKVETYDYISRNRFVSRYKYHHGYFDGIEREFRGFGMVEQCDTEEFATLSNSKTLPIGNNIDASSHVPPVLTKTWFHTGVYLRREHVSDFFAGLLDANDRGEYYREPGWQDDDDEAKKHLLEDTVLPVGLSIEEEREACRTLKGSMLRQEVYALDGTDKAQHPYTVTEQNFTVKCLQSRGDNQHAVFFAHNREAISYHYERDPYDPRTSHMLTLEVDDYGNLLKQVSVGYGRKNPDANLPLQVDRDNQTKRLVRYTENHMTNTIDSAKDSYRAPLPYESCTYELTGYTPTGSAGRFQIGDFVQPDPNGPKAFLHIFDEEINYELLPTDGKKQRRLVEHVRTLYRKNNLTALLPLGELESLALQGESYKLAFTDRLLAQVFQRDGQPLLPVTDPNDPTNVLGGEGADKGGYLSSQRLKTENRFPDSDPDDHWWVPSGRLFYSQKSEDTATQELNYASLHFFMPHRYRNPFHTDAISTESFVIFAYDLLMLESQDTLGNRVTVGERKPDGQIDPDRPGNDYRVLQPKLVTDPNRNRMEVMFDALGMVSGTAVMGKDNGEGDTLKEFEPDLTQAQIDAFYDATNPHTSAPNFLKGATTRIIYDLHRFSRTQKAQPKDQTQWLPVYAANLAREMHVNDAAAKPPDDLKIQISFSYSDGFGREIQKKIQAEPEPAVEGESRWVGSGWIIFNNKGKPIRQYEPFFSQLPLEKRHYFEFGMQVGVSSILFYDPVERVVVTLHPNHTYEKVVFNPWQQTTYDVNDTVAPHDKQTGNSRADPDIQGYVAKYFAALQDDPTPWQTWFEQRQSGTMDIEEQTAADKAAAHADTPTTIYFDTLGRPFLTVAQNRFKSDKDNTMVDEFYATRVELDIEGNQRNVRDAVAQNGDAQGRIVMLYDYDMLGNRIHQLSMEAGERWMLIDVAGKPIHIWKNPPRQKADPVQTFEMDYDELRRPIRSYVTGFDPADFTRRILYERIIYGEQHPQAETHNLRGKIYLQCDGAGVATSEQFDFKGNLEYSARRLARAYKDSTDWATVNAAVPSDSKTPFTQETLEAAFSLLLEKNGSEIFSSKTKYDALNRPIQIIAPHSNQPEIKLNVIQPVYNEANMLERLHVWLDQSTEPAGLIDVLSLPPSPVGVGNIDYNAKGQRQRIDYKNGTITFYEYDEQTFRLIHLLTLRNAVTFPEDCPQPPPEGWQGCQVQNLHYIYDPMGNITHIHDDAQQRIFFRNTRVEPSADYTYDAIYRLIEATGREHLGQVEGSSPTPHSYNDASRVGRQHPNEHDTLGRYKELYVYDEIGNILEMRHYGADLSHPAWKRSYVYGETSLIEDGTTNNTSYKTSNRLSSTTLGGNNPPVEMYSHDNHGNMTHMPQLQIMQYDFKDQLCMTQRQKVNDEDEDGNKQQGERTYYVYDSVGQRTRKVTQLPSGDLKDQRIYLGEFELYLKHSGANAGLVRETLQIMDDKQRIALVETRNEVDDGTAKQLVRYQFGNHLSSAILELDEQAQIISYEEYTSYGSTSYQAVRSQTETPKRYRYTGKERDEESGLYYHEARYYAPWIVRWVAADPLGLVRGTNLYAYAECNPIRNTDPTGTDDDDFQHDTPNYGVEMMQRISVENAVRLGTHVPTADEQAKQRDKIAADERVRRAAAEKKRAEVAAADLPLQTSVDAFFEPFEKHMSVADKLEREEFDDPEIKALGTYESEENREFIRQANKFNNITDTWAEMLWEQEAAAGAWGLGTLFKGGIEAKNAATAVKEADVVGSKAKAFVGAEATAAEVGRVALDKGVTMYELKKYSPIEALVEGGERVVATPSPKVYAVLKEAGVEESLGVRLLEPVPERVYLAWEGLSGPPYMRNTVHGGDLLQQYLIGKYGAGAAEAVGETASLPAKICPHCQKLWDMMPGIRQINPK